MNPSAEESRAHPAGKNASAGAERPGAATSAFGSFAGLMNAGPPPTAPGGGQGMPRRMEALPFDIKGMEYDEYMRLYQRTNEMVRAQGMGPNMGMGMPGYPGPPRFGGRGPRGGRGPPRQRR